MEYGEAEHPAHDIDPSLAHSCASHAVTPVLSDASALWACRLARRALKTEKDACIASVRFRTLQASVKCRQAHEELKPIQDGHDVVDLEEVLQVSAAVEVLLLKNMSGEQFGDVPGARTKHRHGDDPGNCAIRQIYLAHPLQHDLRVSVRGQVGSEGSGGRRRKKRRGDGNSQRLASPPTAW